MKGIKTFNPLRKGKVLGLHLEPSGEYTRVLHKRNRRPVIIKRFIFVDRSRYPGDVLRRLRGASGVGQKRRLSNG